MPPLPPVPLPGRGFVPLDTALEVRSCRASAATTEAWPTSNQTQKFNMRSDENVTSSNSCGSWRRRSNQADGTQLPGAQPGDSQSEPLVSHPLQLLAPPLSQADGIQLQTLSQVAASVLGPAEAETLLNPTSGNPLQQALALFRLLTSPSAQASDLLESPSNGLTRSHDVDHLHR